MKRLIPHVALPVLFALLLPPAHAGDGTVVNTAQTEIYTYVEVEKDGRKMWLAAPRQEVKPGDTVRFDDGMMMTNFYSKALQRTFPSIMFVQQVVVGQPK